jgi:hypothetical protein
MVNVQVVVNPQVSFFASVSPGIVLLVAALFTQVWASVAAFGPVNTLPNMVSIPETP